MVEPVTLAATALAAATPYLIELGKDAAKAVASGAGKSVWDWIKGKLTSPAGQEVVAELEKAPAESLNVKAVEVALAKLLKAEPASLEELTKLLQSAGVSIASQSATIVGDNNAVGQASGGSSVTIGQRERKDN
jgi:hypothetical protein